MLTSVEGSSVQSKHRRAPRGSQLTLPCPTQSLGSVFLWPSPHPSREGHKSPCFWGQQCTEPVGAVCENRLLYSRHVSSKAPPFEKLFSVKLHKIREKGCPWAYCFLFWICSRWSDTNVHADFPAWKWKRVTDPQPVRIFIKKKILKHN